MALRIGTDDFQTTITVDEHDRNVHYVQAYWWTSKGKGILEFLVVEYNAHESVGVNVLEITVDSRDTLEISTRLMEEL